MNAEVDLQSPQQEPAQFELEVIYRDDHYIAINKPSGLLVHRSFLDKHETQFAVQLLRDQIDQHVFPLHRLDRPTSGVLIFALSSEAAQKASHLFSENSIQKRYLALTRGYAPEQQSIDRPLKEKLDKIADKFANQNKPAQTAHTDIRCLLRASLPVALGKYPSVRYSLVECLPKTGRKHQIRRHLNGINYPLINDVNHGDNTHNHFFAQQFGLSRLMLFATDVWFVHPYTKKKVHIRAPIEASVVDVFAQLGWAEAELSELAVPIK